MIAGGYDDAETAFTSVAARQFASSSCRQLRALSSRFSGSGCPEPEGTRLSGEQRVGLRPLVGEIPPHRGRVEEHSGALHAGTVRYRPNPGQQAYWQCFIPDDTLERLPEPSTVGQAKVGGIDIHTPRMRHVAEAVLALSWRPGGFTSWELAEQVVHANQETQAGYSPRQAAYDLQKLRGKQIAERIGKTRH